MNTKFPIEQVREQFPALKRMHNGKPVVYFDGPGGSQFVDRAIKAVCGYMTGGAANLHGNFPTSRETEELIAKAREDIKVLFNAGDCEVAFGPNATTMMFHVSRAISRQWKKGDEILLTELEHHSNIDTWRTAAEEKKVNVKYVPLNTKTLTLDMGRLFDLITSNTRLIAVGAASNCIGTITDVKPFSTLAKKVGAVVTVDAVHGTPHFHIDMREQGIDMLFSSAYKFFAAHVGMAVIRKDLFENLNVYKVVPAPDYIPDRLEIGTQNHEGIPAVSAAIEFIAGLGTGSFLQEKIISGYKAIEEHENCLAAVIRNDLAKIEGITLYQAGDDVPKTPTIAFRAKGITPRDFCIRMCEEHSVFIAEGDFYAKTLAEKLDIRESGSFIRAGMAPYNTMEEVNRFLDGVRAIMSSI
ncbi:MAG: cysteine desulfurase-like protein [Treponema sp.]|jgi:cysteine desulfurase family protein (TIGR01976 family)|nr:cysteine desulfurase-like protein [Treponema sp.]